MNDVKATVSVIGLDEECISLAYILKNLNHKVTVYGPSRSKIVQPYLYPAKDMVAAIEASDLVVTYYRNAPLMDARLCNPDVTYSLFGKQVIHLIVSERRLDSASKTMTGRASREGIDYCEAILNLEADQHRDDHEILIATSKFHSDYAHDILTKVDAALRPLY